MLLQGQIISTCTIILLESFGKLKLQNVRFSDVKQFYIGILKDQKMKATTLESIHTQIHPAFQMAVRDELLRMNPTDGVMTEIKKSKLWDKPKRHALTVPQQKVFMDFLKGDKEHKGWLPIIMVLFGTGMRIGECLEICWEDLYFRGRLISVNHNLTERPDDSGECGKRIQTPKTVASNRTIHMIEEVFQAFLTKYEIQNCSGFCEKEIDGYFGFVFSTSRHTVYSAAAINNAIHRAVSAYNKEEKVRAMKEDRKNCSFRTFLLIICIILFVPSSVKMRQI